MEIINNEENKHSSQVTRFPGNFFIEKEKLICFGDPAKIKSRYHLKLNEVYAKNKLLFQYKYNKYSLPQEYIGKRIRLAVQNKGFLICYNGKMIEKISYY